MSQSKYELYNFNHRLVNYEKFWKQTKILSCYLFFNLFSKFHVLNQLMVKIAKHVSQHVSKSLFFYYFWSYNQKWPILLFSGFLVGGLVDSWAKNPGKNDMFTQSGNSVIGREFRMSPLSGVDVIRSIGAETLSNRAAIIIPQCALFTSRNGVVSMPLPRI